jgi:alpha-glucosidase (family GH31 glycosyl hydrolase)
MPVMRAMPLSFPEEPEAWAFDTQYMLGPTLLVAPILRPGGQIRLYLPHGQWRDFTSGELFEGGRPLELTYPLERFPVFVRGSLEMPLGPVLQHTGRSTGKPQLEV